MKTTRFVILSMILCAAHGFAIEGPTHVAAAVSAIYHEGFVSFRIDHHDVQSIRVKVFDSDDALIFDSGARRGHLVEWGVGATGDGAWRSVVKGWNDQGALVVSQSATSERVDEITTIPFDSVPEGTAFNGSGASIGLQGDVEFGPTNQSLGKLADFYGAGARLDLYDELGFIHSYLSADTSGTGGRLAILRNTSSVGFVVDGNYSGTQKPKISMTGATSAVFDMSLNGGNDSVSLPVDAISSTEMFNEVGVAANWDDTTTTIGSSFGTLVSRTIQAPSVGYVIALAQGSFNINHKTDVNPGASDYISFAVSTNATTAVQGDQNAFLISYSLPPAQYFSNESAIQFFPVTAGSHTFYFNSRFSTDNNSFAQCRHARLTLLFVPTAYGTVSAPTKAGTGGEALYPEIVGEVESPKTTSEIAAEREESIAFNQARIRRELTEMQDQLEALQQELNASE